MARQTKAEKAAQAARLKAELEEIEDLRQPPGQPIIVADESLERWLSSSVTENVHHTFGAPPDAIAETYTVLPLRGDEDPRHARVALIADANGTDSRLVIDGCGVGGHHVNTRIWPDDQMQHFDFDGDTFEQTLRFVATHAIVVIDGGDEIRVGTPPTS